MVAFVSLKREAIHRAVRQMYTAVATRPDQQFHFPTGRHAVQLLGYPEQVVKGLPESALESFAGVGFPHAAQVIRPGDHVLDIGSGSGTDALICARHVGPGGHVYGLDLTEEMRTKLHATAAAAGITHLDVLEGDAEAIPLPDGAVDVVTSNGVLNLVPDKARALAEIFRVLKPGGRVQIADIALAKPVSERYRQDPQLWAECVVGAVDETRYLEMLRQAGFARVEKLGELDYFRFSAQEKTREVAGLFNAHSITLRAEKPLAPATALTRTRRRAALNMVREFGTVAVAMFAWFICAGVPSLIAGFSAAGAGWLTQHTYMFPAFALLMAFSVWLLWRSGRLRREMRPFRLALGSALVAVVATWISLLNIYPPAGWLAYAGVAGVLGASVWSFILARRPGNCVEEMVREAQLRAQRPPPAQRLARAVVSSVALAGVVYLLYTSMRGVTPG